MNRICLFLIVFIVPVLAFSQTNFTEGLLVTNSGDTIPGQIDDRDWKKNPKSIAFRTTVDGQTQTKLPLDVRGFYLKERQEWYKGAAIVVDKSSQRESDVLKNVNVRGIVTDTVFLRLLVKGRLSLSLSRRVRPHALPC